MADQVFNVALGRIVELYNRVKSNDPADSALIVVLLKAAEADATLIDYDTLAAVLGGSNTEADFTNYVRKVLTDAELASLPSPDDINDRYEVDIPDQTWSSAGGASDNTLVKALICYAPAGSDSPPSEDSEIIPLCHFDFPRTTNGADLVMQIHPNGFFRGRQPA